jgi:hypothetical protein
MLKTTAQLQFMLDNLQDMYMQRNVNFLAWRDLYFKKPEAIWADKDGKYISPEPDEKRIILPIAQNIVEGFRELLLAKSPSISVPQSSVEGESLKQAEHNEKTLLAAWDRAEVYERLRDALWHGLVDGWGVMQMVWNKESDTGFPITVLHHDPYNVYAMPSATPNRWQYVIHTYPRLVGSIKEEWPKIKDERKRASKVAKESIELMDLDEYKDTDTVTFFDYWDDEVNAVGISYVKTEKYSRAETIVTRWLKEPTAHGYGFNPWYIMLPCRLPFKNEGEKMGVSILYSVEELIKEKCKNISEKATMVARYMDPPLITITEMGTDFEPVRTERGMHLRLRTGEDAKYLVHPGTPPQLDTLGMELSENIEAAALPKALQGLYEGNVSGIAMSLLRNPTLMKIAFKQKEMERVLENLNSDMLKLLEKKVTKPMYIYGESREGGQINVTFDPAIVDGYYRNSVKLSASLPTDDAGVVNMLATLVQLKIIDVTTARDVAQQTMHDLVPQSLIDEEMKILASMALQDPTLIQSLAMEIAKKVNLPYLQPQPENPQGGYGDKAVQMGAGTLPSQIPNMPGGNTQPGMQQRVGEMMAGQPGASQAPGGSPSPMQGAPQMPTELAKMMGGMPGAQ